MKKVITIVSLSLVGMLILTTIILACITVGKIPAFETPTNLVVYSDELGGPNKSNENAAITKVQDLMKNGVKQKLLQSWFGGTIDNMSVETTESTNYTVSRSNSDETKVVFEYKYGDDKKSIKIEGKSYDYYSIIFQVSDSQSRSVMTAYLIDSKPGDTASFHTKVMIEGNFADLYLAVRALIESHI